MPDGARSAGRNRWSGPTTRPNATETRQHKSSRRKAWRGNLPTLPGNDGLLQICHSQGNVVDLLEREHDWGPPILRSRKIIAAVHIPAAIRHVIVQLAIGSAGEPVRIVKSSGLVLSEQHFELRGVEIAINGVDRRLIGRVFVSQPGVMIIR